MSVKTQTEQPQKFTSVGEVKRWQGEREDRLHQEYVLEKMRQSQAQKRPKLPREPARRKSA